MILGAGTYQVPLIKKAKEMGFETIVLSIQGKYPGIELADQFFPIDTTDVDSVLSTAKRLDISAILTSGTDVCLPAIGKVIDELKLHGTGYQAACKSTDKTLMKEAFHEHSVMTAPFQIFKDSASAKKFAAQLGFPVMVKAADSSGSRGITKVNSEHEFDNAWIRASETSRSKQIIIEKFLTGVEFGAQAFIHGDQVMEVFFHGDTLTPPPYLTPIGHSMPSLMTSIDLQKSRSLIDHAARSVGLRDCISNVDMMMVDGVPYIIEIGARMGATCIPENIATYAGIDPYEHAILLSLGEHPRLTNSKAQPNASRLICAEKTGIVEKIEVPTSVSKHPDLVELQWDIQVGDRVSKFIVGSDRIGHLLVKSNNPTQAEQLAEKLTSEIRLQIS